MRGLAWVVLVCGCDKLLGLASVNPASDATGGEPSTMDASPTCPTSGPPMFDATLVSAVQGCVNYSLSDTAALAVGLCGSPGVLSSGAIDQPMTAATTQSSAMNFYAPAIDADGDEILVIEDVASAYVPGLLVWNGSAWQDGALTLPFTPQMGDLFTAPTHKPTRRMLWYEDATSMWHDLIETTRDSWSDVRQFTTTSLGVESLTFPQLSSDGLRLLGYDTLTQQYEYTQRAAVGEAFPPVQALTTVTVTTGNPAFLTDGCARLYLTVVTSTYYVREL